MAKFEIDPEYVRKLAEIMNDTGLWEMQMRVDDTTVRLSKGPQNQHHPVAAPVSVMPTAVHPQMSAVTNPVMAPQETPASTTVQAPAPAETTGNSVNSPMVGTVYLAPEPGASPFVSVGDKVREGQTLVIVEAMKVMNPIPAPQDGVIRQIIVKDGSPVEFGEPLVLMD